MTCSPGHRRPEESLERVNANQLALLKLMDTEERSEAGRLCSLSVTAHPEINVLAFMIGDLRDAGITDMAKQEDEYCVRAVRNLLDAIIQTRGLPGGDSSESLPGWSGVGDGRYRTLK